MADFVAEEEEQQNPVGVSECLVDPRRRMVQLGLGWADNSEAISETLLNEVGPKAIPLDLHYPTDAESTFFTYGFGQCGLIRKGGISRSPGQTTFHCTVVPLSAKHNFRIVAKKDQTLIPTKATMHVEVGFAHFVTEDLGWSPSQADEFDIRKNTDGRPAITLWGKDISVGQEIVKPSVPLTDPAYAFQLLRTKLKLEVGMKVGIAVNFRRKAKPTESTVKGSGPNMQTPMLEKLARDKVSMEDIYGEPDRVNVYTGEITYVGKDHIEYSCNTFTSCSGAIVFLLDKNQPGSVQRCDFGKAVAVHSGSHPFLPTRNYGFRIRSHPAFEGFDPD